MKFSYSQTVADFDAANSVILPLNADLTLTESLQKADKLLAGAISAAISSEDLNGKVKNQHLFLNAGAGPQRILVVGTGASDKLNAKQYRQLQASAWGAIKANAGAKVVNELCLAQSDQLSPQDQVRLTLETLTKSEYRCLLYTSDAADE